MRHYYALHCTAATYGAVRHRTAPHGERTFRRRVVDVTEERGLGRCPMAVVLRDGVDQDTVVKTACHGGRATSSSVVSQRGGAPVSTSTSVIYRSSSNRLHIHAASTSPPDHRLTPTDQHWNPYILEYMCKLQLTGTQDFYLHGDTGDGRGCISGGGKGG